MIDNFEYFKEKGNKAKQTLLSLGCQQCTACQLWMHQEYIGAEGICKDCAEEKEPFKMER